MSGGTYRLGDLTVDLARRRVQRGEAVLEVAGLSFDLLAYLLRQGDRVVGFDALIAGVWAPAVVGEETVTQRVRLLRQALGDDGRNPRYLRSVRGRGYQLCLAPVALPAQAVDASTETVMAATGAARVGTASADAVDAAQATNAANASPANTASGAAEAAATSSMSAAQAAGLADNAGAMAAAAATAQTAGTTHTTPAAAHAASPSRRLRNLALLITMPVALLVLLWTLSIRDDPPRTADAREEMLQRARYYAGIGQKDDVERAVGLYEALLQRDPADRAAQVGLSFAYSTRVCLYNQDPAWAARAQALAETALAAAPRDSLAEAALAYSHDCRGQLALALRHYERAVAQDPGARIDSAASLAYLYLVKGRLADALARHLEVARSGRRPRYLDIQIARNLELLGATAAAERGYARSFRLYPDNVYSNAAWPRCLFLQGRLGEAEAALAEAQQRSEHPELHLLAAELALLRGRRDAATAAFAAAARLRPHASMAQTLARLHAAQPPDADWLAQRRAALAPPAGGNPDWPEDQLELALIEIARGDTPAALAALRAAVAAGWRDRAYLQTSALFRPLAAEPGFAALLEDIAGRVATERRAAATAMAEAERLSALRVEPASP